MSGIDNSTKQIVASGNAAIDGILSTAAWNDDVLYYAFPGSAEPFGYHISYHDHKFHDYYSAISNAQQAAIGRMLDTAAGPAAAAGFSFEGFTNMATEGKGDVFFAGDIEILVAQTSSPLPPFNSIQTAMAVDLPNGLLTPDTDDDNGDVWFGVQTDFRNPVAGNYAWMQHLHELGHALGLTHGHQAFGLGKVLPVDLDAMEYSVMSYRSYVGATADGAYSNADGSYAQTWMMQDIAALQYMYGADYSTNNDNTVYKWTPGSGDTLVNGAVGIDAVSNKIFATIWDGGGEDTYDLRAYRKGVEIDLRPGKFSSFSDRQKADLDNGEVFADGNIYNAHMYHNNRASLIENAYTGRGNDIVNGNQAGNYLRAGSGNDILHGFNRGDTLLGNQGNDTLYGDKGDDTLHGGNGRDVLYGGSQADLLNGNRHNDRLFGQQGHDSLYGGGGNDLLVGGLGNDQLFGNIGRDTIKGQQGNDTLFGGKGNDRLIGGAGQDDFVYTHGSNDGNDRIVDFQDGIDTISITGGSFAALTIQQRGAHTNIHDTDGTDILLLNVDAALIGAEDFQYL